MSLQLDGLHHVSAISARIVKKSVNQDDTSSYHLFYVDAVGTSGSDMTYFDIPMAGSTHEGVSSIINTAFRIKSEEALHYELALPPFLEPKRKIIEAKLRPLSLQE